MNVCVVLDSSQLLVGGGFALQQQLFLSLLSVAHESNHSFFIYGNEIDTGSLPDLPANVHISPSHSGDLLVRIQSRLRREIHGWKQRRKRLSLFEELLVTESIDYVWVIGSSVPAFPSEDLNFPYMAMIWDLEHRLKPWLPEFYNKPTWEIRDVYYETFFKRAATLLVGTEEGRRELEYFYRVPSQNIRKLPLPTPSFALDNTLNQQDIQQILGKFGLSPGFLLYPAQFWAHKNHVNLLLAINKLREVYGLEIPFVFTGTDHGNLSYIREFCYGLGLDSQAHFLGFVTREDLTALYKSAFALTFMSLFGPNNLPPLEAFALGCPVIAAHVPGSDEQLGDAAILVDPLIPDEITAGIKKLYDDPDFRQTLIKRGIVHAQNWTGKDFVRGVFNILDEFSSIRCCWHQG